MSRVDAHQFLGRLERHLNSELPSAGIVRAAIAGTVKEVQESDLNRQNSFPEGAFLNLYIIRSLHRFLISEGFSDGDAKRALLSESYRSHRGLVSGSPVRPGPHPFRKVVASPREILDIWRGRTPQKELARNSCPDLALRDPFPHRTVFEAKYHAAGGKGRAETELVRNIYQAFFYLGLPHLPESKTHAAWNYEYACVLAYDASVDGTLIQAWASLPDSVKSACWTGANVYVMILRGL